MNEYYIQKLKQSIKGRVAIHIDAANLEQSIRSIWVNPKDVPSDLANTTADKLSWKMDYERFKTFFSQYDPSTKIHFYTAKFETASHDKFLTFLRTKGKFKLYTKTLKQYADHTPELPHRKANFDVELAINAIETKDEYDTFVLFSGDCDFEYLLKHLRSRGKQTIVFSHKGHVAKELPPASNQYFDIIDFRYECMHVVPKTQRTSP